MAQQTGKGKPAKRMKNLVLRGGIYYVRKKVDGHVVRISTEQTDRVAAEIRAIDIIAKLNRDGLNAAIGKTAKVAVLTYGECGRRLWKINEADPKKVTYESCLATSIDAWDKVLITKVTPSMCLEYMAAMRQQHYAENTIAQHVNLSCMVFNLAVSDLMATRNPWHAKSVGKARPSIEARTRVLAYEEQELLFPAFYEAYPWLERLARILVGAGLRIGEATKVVPRTHIDLVKGYFRLTADITKGNKARAVPIFPDVREAILEELAGRGLRSETPLIPFTPKHIQRLVQRVRRRVDVPHVTPHDFRRTFGTRMALDGVPMKTLQVWMGHSKIEITAKYYTHVTEATDLRIVQEVTTRQRARTQRVATESGVA